MPTTPIPSAPTLRADGSESEPSRRPLLAGIAFVVFFLSSVVASSVPANGASDAAWVSAYAGHAHQVGHMATGVLLVLAALSLLTFLTALWGHIARAQAPRRLSPVPLVAAAVSAACIAAGGVVQASISGAELSSGFPLPSAQLLRFSDYLGFALVAVGGMLAAALAVVCLSIQGRAAGIFGRRTATFGIVVSLVLLASVAFVPIAALWIWAVVMTIQLVRRPASVTR